MKGLIVVLLVGLLLGSGCSHLPGAGAGAVPSTSAGATGAQLAKAGDWLDAEVPMPSGFPADVPVYSGARLTAAAMFGSGGQVAWGMEWETRDPQTKVQPFFEKQFAQGDWTIHPFSSTTNLYSAKVARKSNSRFGGTLALDYSGSNGKILLSLLNPTA